MLSNCVNSTGAVCLLPVYSLLEGVDEAVDSFSQSFSPLRLPVEGHEEKPSAESGLEMITNQQMTRRRDTTKNNKRHVKVDTHKQVWKPTDYTDMQTRTERERDVVKQGQTPWHSSPNPACCLALHHTVHIRPSCAARDREACSAKQSEVSALSLWLLWGMSSSTCGRKTANTAVKRKAASSIERRANNSLRAILGQAERGQRAGGGNISGPMYLNAEAKTAVMKIISLLSHLSILMWVYWAERMSNNEMQAKVTWSYVYMELVHYIICWSITFRSVTNLPFLSLGELRKNGTLDTLLPLRGACKVEREIRERDTRESRV